MESTSLLNHLSGWILVICSLIFSGNVFAQEQVVSGTITDENGSPVPGVNIVIKGTTVGVTSNVEGVYKISVSPTATLRYSYIGYLEVEEVVGARTLINVTLVEDVKQLKEVVVTALGIKREEPSLGFSVGRLAGEETNRVVQENVLNSMSGKVAGVTINSTGGTGSSVQMVIRGAYSLSSDNQPLFVVNGVPITNTVNNTSRIGNENTVDYGNAISDLNPNDIKEVTVLRGPSAAALYGSRAGNGVVLITTKTGEESKGIDVTFNSNTVMDIPYRFLDFHYQFASGYFSFTPDNFSSGKLPPITIASGGASGPELDKGYFAIQWDPPLDALGNPVPTELVSYPDNVRNFLRNGITTTNGVSISNNNGRMNYRLGITDMRNQGMIPNSDLFRNNVSFASSFKALEKLTISSDVNISRNWSNNRPASNRGTNPLQWAYGVPANIDIRRLEDYWVEGKEGIQQKAVANTFDNPYFLANEVNNSFIRNRVFGNLKADFQLLPELNIMMRYALDQYNEQRETKIAPSYSQEPNNGAYGLINMAQYERNADVLATYTKEISDLGISVSVGGNNRYHKWSGTTYMSKPGEGLIVPNVYSISNISQNALGYGSGWGQEAIYSVYGMANLSYNDMVYVDFTARNDWSSTLPKENRSYFYPSVATSLLINKMADLGSRINMLKLRGGWAQAGNDGDPYQLTPTYGNMGQWGSATR
ncbi:MAG: SusC/RagA family TonB-linked outer membrane protein, partial [Cyclobacteriaceae bacterium]|nr:SusC/RagA family TonB-linked outer membrane protein [Cyclobacteriaceae bacterium]